MNISIPTSKDIYIEVDGKKVAIVQSYKAKATREVKEVDEFGNNSAIINVSSNNSYALELSRVLIVDSGERQVDFHSLSKFRVIVVKPNQRIVYSGCEWVDIAEGLNVGGGPCIETIKLVAAKRSVL